MSSSIFYLPSNWTTTDMVYSQYGIDDDSSLSFCIARFNSTHEFGCSNAQHTNQNGLPFFIHSETDIDHLIKQANKSSSVYILIINVFEYASIFKFRYSSLVICFFVVFLLFYFRSKTWTKYVDHISGVIFYRSEKTELNPIEQYESYSQDTECPNSYFGSNEEIISSTGQCLSPWISSNNPFIDFALTKWPFPMFYVQNKTLLERLMNCASNKWANLKTQCMVGLKFDMYGALNSVRCTRRNQPLVDQMMFRYTSYCNPIMAKNLFSSFIPVPGNYSSPNRSIIVLTARLDSFTTFSSSGPSDNSVYSALITLITTAFLLNKKRDQLVKHDNENLKNVMYALFDGESMGYIGSTSSLFYNNFVVSLICWVEHDL